MDNKFNLLNFFKIDKDFQENIIHIYDDKFFSIVNFHDIQNDYIAFFLGKESKDSLKINKLFSVEIPEEEKNNSAIKAFIESLIDSGLNKMQWILFCTEMKIDEKDRLIFEYCVPKDLKQVENGELLGNFLENFISKESIIKNKEINNG